LSSDLKAKEWLKVLKPLEKVIRNRYLDYLAVFDFPIRRGIHQNTAYSMIHAIDYAKVANDAKLMKAISDTAKKYFLNDKNCPLAYEPGGDDFASPCLTEADLMRKILPGKTFLKWFDAFWPNDPAMIKKFMRPHTPTSIQDGLAGHLIGLAFQKAWSLEGIARALPATDQRKKLFLKSASEHARLGETLISQSNYESGLHWLASYAIYYWTRARFE
jgi:hypothetical protein